MAGGTARRAVAAIRLCLLLGAAIFGSCDGLKRGRLTIDTGGRAPFPAFNFSVELDSKGGVSPSSSLANFVDG